MVRDRRRSRRRRAGGRSRTRVAAGVVGAAAGVVLLVGSIASIGPASVPFQRTIASGFAELATPIARASTATGARLAATLAATASSTRPALFAALDESVADAAGEASQMAAAGTPPAAAGSSGGCVAALWDRARGAAETRDGIEGVLGGPTATSARADDQPTALRTLSTAGALFAESDTLWEGCRVALRHQTKLARVPISVWVVDPAFWETAVLQGFVEALVGLPGLAPAPHLAISALTTAPPAVGPAGAPGVLPPSSSLVVVVVLSNTGNVDERGIRVEAAASAIGAGPPPGRGVTRIVDVEHGKSLVVTLPGISIRPGGTFDVVVTAVDAAGGVSPSASLTVEISPPPTTTTPTTVARSAVRVNVPSVTP
ncbi:MAG TPA: hypothetical protein VED63_10895 [Acidimicrobiales bacterium]|nr:hypothetical protein [Acidimicrobiales bacterium]